MNTLSLMDIWQWFYPVLITAAYAVAAVFLFRWTTSKARDLRGGPRPWADLLVLLLGWPLIAVLVLGGLLILYGLLPVSPATANFIFALEKIALVVLVMMLAHHVLFIFFRSSERNSWLRIPLLRKLVLLAVYIIGILIIIEELGLHSTPLLLVIGFMLFAVALGLHEILANYLAGFQLSLDQSIRVGQTVEIDHEADARYPASIRGKIIDIGWMKTHLVDEHDQRISVPNRFLINHVVTQALHAGRAGSSSISIGIHRDNDLDRVRHVAGETTRKVLEANGQAGGETQYEVYYEDIFGESEIELVVTFYCDNPKSIRPIRSDLVSALSTVFAQSEIKLA